MDKIFAIQASFNHNLSLTSEGKVLTWGYSGFNILGRKPKQLFNNLPLQIFSDFRAEKQGLFQSQHSVNVAQYTAQMKEVNNVEQNDFEAGTTIEKVACTLLNTVVVTNAGELFIFGSNTFN